MDDYKEKIATFLKILSLFVLFTIDLNYLFGETQDSTAKLLDESNKQYYILGKSDIEASNKLTMINVRLDKKPQGQNFTMENHDSFIQIRFPNTITPTPGNFIDSTSPYIKKMTFYQVTDTDSMARIFTTVEAKHVISSSEIDVLDNRVVLTLNHSLLRPKLEVLSSNLESPKTSTKTMGPQSTLASISQDKSTNSILNTPLEKGAAVSMTFILLLLLYLTLKRVVKNRRIYSENKEEIELKTLGHLNLSQKQRVSLLQIGTEKILISVTPENINLLMKYEDRKKVSLHPSYRNREVEYKSQQQQQQQQQQGQIKKPPMSMPSITTPHLRRDQFEKRQEEVLQTRKEINYRIDNDGYHKSTLETNSTEKAIADVKKIIKERLKGLPKL